MSHFQEQNSSNCLSQLLEDCVGPTTEKLSTWKLVCGKKRRKEVTKTTNISIMFSLTSISVTISLNKHNVQNHFLDLAGSEKLTATWKSCIMNVNICHLQVSHSQTLIQPRAGCGKGEGGQMERGEEEGLWRVKVKPSELV